MEKLFALWRFYTLSPDEYVRCMNGAIKQNVGSFLYLSVAYTVFLLVVFGYSIPSIFWGTIPVLGQRYNVSYLLTMLIMLAVSISLNCLFMYRRKQAKSGKHLSDRVTSICGVFQFIFAMFCSLYLSVWTSPNSLAVGFMLILACSTFLILMPPPTNITLISGATISFVISTVLLSSPSIWSVNILHVSAAAGLGAVLNWIVNMYKMQALSSAIKLEHEYKLNAELQAKEKDYYFAQCQLMQESATQVRAVQHDMKNHLATIDTYTKSGNYEGVKSYLDSLMDGIEKSELYSDTGNIAFDSVINYKLRNAKSDNIQLTLSIAVSPELNVDVVDVVTVLGNMLDNALDAVAKVDEKMIKLDIEFVKGGLFIKVDNSFNGEVKYLNENDGEERKIASLKDGEEHGYGLKNIMQSVEKYNGHMEISHTSNIFSVGVFLHLTDLDVTGAKR